MKITLRTLTLEQIRQILPKDFNASIETLESYLKENFGTHWPNLQTEIESCNQFIIEGHYHYEPYKKMGFKVLCFLPGQYCPMALMGRRID